MLTRIYIAPQIVRNQGTEDEYISSLLNDFVDVQAGDWFDEIDNPNGRRSLCTVHASQATHDAIYADRLTHPNRIIYLMPMASHETNVKTLLNKTLGELPAQFKTYLQNEINNHFPNVTLTDDMTLKFIIRKVIHRFFDFQRASAGHPSDDWTKMKIHFAGEDF